MQNRRARDRRPTKIRMEDKTVYKLLAEDLELLNQALSRYDEIEIQRTPDSGFRIIGKKVTVNTLRRRPEKVHNKPQS